METNHEQKEAIEPLQMEQLKTLVEKEFEVEEALIEFGTITFYIKLHPNSKQAFLKLVKALEPTGYLPVLRKKDGRPFIKLIVKPKTKPSNPKINLALFLITILTTFVTGYMLSLPLAKQGLMENPLVGAAAFSAAIMAILGSHEMGHKLAANKHGIEATLPYFIPGPPPVFGVLGIGTFGAVIMQKSLPPNKDALFDVGASGPIIGFLVSVAMTIIGFSLSSYTLIPENSPTLPVPLLFLLMINLFPPPGSVPTPNPGEVVAISLHPIAFAGWVGMFVTMLNLLPAAMLDGGHIVRCFTSERTRIIFSALSIVFLIATGLLPMALFVLFMSMYRHPGPLDDVSKLSWGRKLLVVFLVFVFFSCLLLYGPVLDLVRLLMRLFG